MAALRFRFALRVLAAVGAAACAGRAPVPRDAGTAPIAQQSAIMVPFELVDNIVYLRVGVNGAEPMSFILDTGASQDVLSVRTARARGLHLRALGKVEGGIGAESPDAFIVSDTVSLALQGTVYRTSNAVAVALEQAEGCATAASRTVRPMDGILGGGFLRRYVVEIDYAARIMTLHEPRTYKYSGNGERLPLEVLPQFSLVRARVTQGGGAPVVARLLVDTGSQGALTLGSEFIDAHRLLPPEDQLTRAIECGIAGVARDTLFTGKVDALQLGSYRLAGPETDFRRAPLGRGYDGLLGGAILRDLTVIFDYSRGQMIIERRP